MRIPDFVALIEIKAVSRGVAGACAALDGSMPFSLATSASAHL
jgi:hypothetical protein